MFRPLALIHVLTLLLSLIFLTSIASASSATPKTGFHVNSITMTVSPSTLSTWKCGSFIQITWNAIFHLTPGTGGLLQFSYTENNGRSQTPVQLTILPGQVQTNFLFTWQGALPLDHTQPGLGGVLVTAPNILISPTVKPGGFCR